MTKHSAAEPNEPESEFNLDLLGIIRRRIHLIAFGLLLGTTAATVYYQKQESIYESHLKVLVSQRSTEVARTGVRSADDATTPVQDKILATHIQLFTSPKVLQKAVEDHGLTKNAGEIAAALTITKVGDASILKATYQDTDPKVAAHVLQSVFETYHDYVESQSNTVGKQAIELIATTQQKNEDELRRADEAYREFVASVPALVGSGGQAEDVHRNRVKTIEAELAKVQQALAEASSRRHVILAATKGKKPEQITDAQVMSLLSERDISRLNALVQIKERRQAKEETNTQEEIDDAMERKSWEVEFQRLMSLSSQLQVMRTTYLSGHPSVRALEAEIQSVREYVNKYRNDDSEKLDEPASADPLDLPPSEILQTYYEILKSDIDQYESRERELLAQSKHENELAKEVELTVLEGEALKANLQRAQARYDEVFKRLQELTLTNEYSGFSTDLLVTPKPANFPFWPSKPKIAISGIMSGLMVGFLLAMVAEFRDRTFRNPSDLSSSMDAPVLAHVPTLVERKLRKTAIADSNISPMVATFHEPCGNEAESYRVLRTSLLLSAKRDQKRVILVTSPSPGDGKTTTTCNLAVSLAQTGKRVLLIDADMRRPMVDSVFGIDNTLGLSDLMRGHRALSMCLHECEQLNLTLCPSGSQTASPSELLESQRFSKFIEHMRSVYDIILIDSPPVLAVADPVILADRVDSCLLVTKVKTNNAPLIERAGETLRQQGATLGGLIVSPDEGRYGYASYNYHSKHEYGYLRSYQSYYRTEEPHKDSGRRRRQSGRETSTEAAVSAVSQQPDHGNVEHRNGHETITVSRP